MSKTSCITLPPNDFFTVTRNCYLQICSQNGKSDECAAKLLDMLVNFHDWRLAMGYFDPKKPILQNHTYEQLRSRLLKTFGITKIKESIGSLVQSGFLKIHSNPDPRYKSDRTHYYEVIPAKIQQELNMLETGSQSHQSFPTDARSETTNHYQDPYQDLIQDLDRTTSNLTAPAADFSSESTACGLNPPEAALKSSHSSSYQPSAEQSKESLLEGNRAINHLPLVNSSDLSREKRIAPPHNTIADKNKTIFDRSTLGKYQQDRAKKNNRVDRGIANNRWKDLADYKKFREYAVEWARLRREGAVAGSLGVVYDDRWVEAVLDRTADCSEDSPNLTCWRGWITDRPTALATEIPEREMPVWTQESVDCVTSYLNNLKTKIAVNKKRWENT